MAEEHEGGSSSELPAAQDESASSPPAVAEAADTPAPADIPEADRPPAASAGGGGDAPDARAGNPTEDKPHRALQPRCDAVIAQRSPRAAGPVSRERRNAPVQPHDPRLAEDRRAAFDEADRRLAALARSEAKAEFYEALFSTAWDALSRILEPPPGASEGKRAALEELRHDIEDLLEDAYEALPQEIDEKALNAQIAAGTTGDVDFEPFINKVASKVPLESRKDVAARVLAERGYSATEAVAIAREISTTEANTSSARTTLRRVRDQERERRNACPGEPSARVQAELDEVMRQAEPERLARLERRVRRWRNGDG